MEVITTGPNDALAWLLPVVAVVLLAAVTVAFAIFIGRWIDAQGKSVVDDPRERRKRER